MNTLKNFTTIHFWIIREIFGSCITLNDFSNKACVPRKTEDLSPSILNTITGINESETLTKHVS